MKQVEAGRQITDFYHEVGIPDTTYYVRTSTRGGTDASDMRRPRNAETKQTTLDWRYAAMAMANLPLSARESEGTP